MQTLRAGHSRRRSGFTLMELMVVIAIIVVLVSLTAGAVIRTIDSQRKANTEQTIQTVNAALNQQWNAVVQQAKKEEIPAGILAMAGNNVARARVIWIKLRLRQEFPESFAEALAPFPAAVPAAFNTGVILPPLYSAPLQSVVVANHQANTESSALLVLALQRGRSGVKVNKDTFGTSIDDTDTDGLKEFIDGWVFPLAFYKWPIGSFNQAGQFVPSPYIVELDGDSPGPANSPYRDPLDPTGLLLDPSWNSQQNYSQQLGVYWFEQLLHPVHVMGANGWTPTSWFTMPTLASAGQDNVLGDSDDILSFRLREGARGN